MKQKLTLFLLTLVMLVLMIPSQIFGATKYFSVNRAEDLFIAFQEDAKNQIDTTLTPSFYINSGSKFVIKISNNEYIGANKEEISTDLDKLLESMPDYKRGDIVCFNLFLKDYIPKKYLEMLDDAKILVFDMSDNKVDEFPLLEYKEYTEFPNSDKYFNVKLNGYTEYQGNIKANTGVDLIATWTLDKDDAPLELSIVNKKAGFNQAYDVRDRKSSDSVTMNIEMRYNGDYTLVLGTEKGEYSQTLTFNKLQDDLKEDTEKDEVADYVEKGDNFDKSSIKVEVSKIPSNLEEGQSFTLTLTTNVDTEITAAGMSSPGYKKKHTFNIASNGVYNFTVVSQAGKYVKKTVKVTCFHPAKIKAESLSFSRANYWDGDATNLVTNDKLVQTGKYDYTIFVVSGVLLVLGSVIVLVVVKGKKKENIEK